MIEHYQAVRDLASARVAELNLAIGRCLLDQGTLSYGDLDPEFAKFVRVVGQRGRNLDEDFAAALRKYIRKSYDRSGPSPALVWATDEPSPIKAIGPKKGGDA